MVCACTIHNNVKLMMITTTSNEIPLLHHNYALAKVMCNPTLPSCHSGSRSFCTGKEPLHEMLERCFDEAGADEIEFKQWTATDRSNMETVVQPKDKLLDSFVGKLDAFKRISSQSRKQPIRMKERII